MDMNKIRWMCRKGNPFLYGEYLDLLADDYGMPVKACELDCDDCTKQHDVITNRDGSPWKPAIK
jgi:hypothetical protein